MNILLPLLLSAVLPAGAAVPEALVARSLPVAEVPAPVPAGPGFCIFNGSSGAPLAGEEAFRAAVAGADVVYAGETHDQFQDHLAQLEALKALNAARGEKVAVGFEMLNFTLQPILDAYASGAISEAEFLKQADWQKEWGFDFNLYKPIFDFIREHKLRALALNLPKRIVSKIARVGLDGLTPEEKAMLPEGMQVTTNARYIAYVRETFEGHGDNPMSGMFKFENYLASMSAWNETMGARLAGFLNANPGYAGLAVAGSGHVIFNAGIPASVMSRTYGLRHLSFYPQQASACPAALPAADAGLADYVWYKDYGPGR
jgi:uncharacterized iron-regulated protein